MVTVGTILAAVAVLLETLVFIVIASLVAAVQKVVGSTSTTIQAVFIEI